MSEFKLFCRQYRYIVRLTMTIDVWTLNEESTRQAAWTDCVSHTMYDVHQTNTTCILFGTWENDWALSHKRKRWMCFYFILFCVFFSLCALYSVLHCLLLLRFRVLHCIRFGLRIMDLCLFMIFRGCGALCVHCGWFSCCCGLLLYIFFSFSLSLFFRLCFGWTFSII